MLFLMRLLLLFFSYLGMSRETAAPLELPGDQQLADAPQNADDAFRNSAGIVCRALPGLVAAQIEVCQSFPNTIKSVSDGAKRGIQECQYQFRYERWNCTASPEDHSVFGYALQRGKETIPTFPQSPSLGSTVTQRWSR